MSSAGAAEVGHPLVDERPHPLAALRVGAGRITLCVAESVASATAVALPECGVVPLEETRGGSISGRGLSALEGELGSADVALIGPGLDDHQGRAGVSPGPPSLTASS